MANPMRLFAAWLLVASIPATIGLTGPASAGSDSSAPGKATSEIRHPYNDQMLVLFPESYTKHPGLPSPWKAPNGTELFVGRTKAGHFTLLPVTIVTGL